MKRIIYLFLVTSLQTFAQNSYLVLTVKDFSDRLTTTPTAQLIDISSPNEFSKGHLKKAINIDFNDDSFEKNIENKLDKSKPVFMYSYSGGKSTTAANLLLELGFKQIFELEGGLAKWTAASKPYTSATYTTQPIAAFTSENITDILKNNHETILYFVANWSTESKKMTPILHKLVDENYKVKLLKIDADMNDGIAHNYQIDAIPTYIIFRDGKQIWRSTGEISEAEFREIFSKLKIQK